jgi:DNA-directed RNA polymerase subunit H (RpoH/RPB5)
MSRKNASTAVPPSALWKATRMVLDMFRARGYAHTVQRFQTDKCLFREYVEHVGADMGKLRIVGTDHKGRCVCACFVADRQFKKEQAVKLIAELAPQQVRRLVLVWSQPGSVSAVALLRQHCELETWTYALAQSQFHRHTGVAMQRRLTKRERAAFFKTYRLTPALMGSTMHTGTPIAKFLDAQIGDVMHVWRVTHGGVSRAYRYVK